MSSATGGTARIAMRDAKITPRPGNRKRDRAYPASECTPVSVEEAARIDGAGVFRSFWSVVLPMARPALITLFILSFQGSWNEFAFFLVARQSTDLHTLTTGVATLTSGQLGEGSQYPLKLAAAVLMSIPVAVLFFIFQRRIMSTAEGAEKG